MIRYACFHKVVLVVITAFISRFSVAQTFNKAAANAFVITRMVEKFHIQPRSLNDSLSSDLFNQVLTQLDEERIYFNKQDIQQLAVYRFQLDDQIRQKQTGFLTLVKDLYTKKLLQADTMLDAIAKNPFDFSVAEKLSIAEDSSFPDDVVAMHDKLYKKIKLEVLYRLIDFNNRLSQKDTIKYKQQLDSAQTALQKKTISAYKRDITRIRQFPGGLEQFIADVYCEALASCYDPHTEFFSLTEEENFEGALGNQQFRFGFSIKEDAGGGVLIHELQPGSPAFKSGVLNKGDKFQTLQWENQTAIDVSDAAAVEVRQILAQSNHDKLTITVKKADGSSRTVTLVKEQVDPSDDAKVKSFLLKGSKTFGYISLPAFYNDWEDEGKGHNGCANDVTKEIIKLKKENIAGLILDLRYNGGGSVQEAAELAGIFIDAGPVAQIKTSSEEKVFTLKDVNRGTIYDGPLLVLVNGYSASASELLAAALQDYNRALIVGAATYGKATGQLVLPLDTAINIKEDNSNKEAAYYLKVTTIKLYRINGTTAQFTGVKPDIVLPDYLQTEATKEADEPFALQPTAIETNKYYTPYAVIHTDALKALAKQDADTITYFKQLNEYIRQNEPEHLPADISLNWKDALDVNKADSISRPLYDPDYSKNYIIQNNAYDIEKMKIDVASTAMNETFKRYLSGDPYIKISYDLLDAMAK